jgi:hypothetical protein
LKLTLTPATGTDEESPVKVTPKKEVKDGVIRPNGTIKLKRPAPKHNKPGNWRDGSVVDGESPLHILLKGIFQGICIAVCLMGGNILYLSRCLSFPLQILDLLTGALKYRAEADMLILLLQKTRNLESA